MSSSSSASTTDKKQSVDVAEADVRPSVSLRMIRHAESNNNQVYRNARYIYRGGTADFDQVGWEHYVATHRRADPALSTNGVVQAQHLREYLGPHLQQQASQPVHVITSPMRRTLETIRPTIEYLVQQSTHAAAAAAPPSPIVHVTVQAFCYESDGCHTKDKPEPGMNRHEITALLHENLTIEQKEQCVVEFVGFPSNNNNNSGWYSHATGAETRAMAETRAAKFYLWLCHYLDEQLTTTADVEDIFDAGVRIAGEEDEVDFDYFAPRLRRRRTYLLVGHGDFMSLVLKRIMAGYGYAIEHEGAPHRSAMVHHNTGMTTLEYFGQGRFLLMQHNATPHLNAPALLSGGSLKDGWSYIVPTDDVIYQNVEVNVAFADEMSNHVREQTHALRALYLSSSSTNDEVAAATTNTADASLTVQEQDDNDHNSNNNPSDTPAREKHFVVQRGHQVVAVAAYSETTGVVTDVAVQPGATGAREALLHAVQEHARKLKRSGSLIMHPRTAADQDALVKAGFQVKDDT